MNDKRVCLLTGASGALGMAFCRAYCPRYSIVAVYHRHLPQFPSQHLSYIDPLRLNAVLPANEHRVWAVQADLRREDTVERVVEVAMSRFGRVDLLVNAAAKSYWGGFLDDGGLVESWQEHADLNVGAPLRLTRQLCRALWRDHVEDNRRYRRHVVNISSTAGVFVYPGHGQSVYGASKAALNHVTVHLADELSVLGIRVNAVAPNSFPGIVSVEDVVRAIVDLDDRDASGEVVVVDAEGTYALT
jgi:NAD(P)-dependent dehydrogenase (short-subunit alcohol dehydrogenase family)